ncbi:MAG: SecC motif-containing protein [Psychromonas sp.]|nr:SecC motif-containing protein [Psychromonas sp.]
MKIKRNDPCSCGSGKKYKKCCINAAMSSLQSATQRIQTLVEINPGLTKEVLQAAIDEKLNEQNSQGNDDFCGLSSDIIHSWLHDSCLEADKITITAPDTDAVCSPLVAYVDIIISDILENKGKLKATAKGNLPAKTVKKAAAILNTLAVAKYETEPSISEYTGSNEDRFEALHVSRALLQQSAFIKLEKGHFSLTEKAEALYQQQGANAFFVPLLQFYIEQYNWGYLDSYSEQSTLSKCWAFCFWRLQQHKNFEQMCEEVDRAFPMLQSEIPLNENRTQQDELQSIIEIRLLKRFMRLFGFAIVNPKRVQDNKLQPLDFTLLPLFSQVIGFDI